ncbi:DUF3955 domain-containing protein [Ruegeria profundi]|uniref:DUF3955 domain-containing protein n=1 Tax=Ruegeria profundi TaxID=1685378 RepID=A0A0X3TS41_9RHOB|nr:DUF3955 domain-containing protein [Ruegeria profundi]KUJ78509.1 hypothetical protein AVO44_12395 [Ruegeria profundi]
MISATRRAAKVTLISALFSLTIGAALWVLYWVQGVQIDEDGVLREAFFLLGLGWIFTLGAVAMLLTSLFLYFWNR